MVLGVYHLFAVSLLKMELLHVRRISRSFNKKLVGGMFLLHKSKKFLTEDNPKLLSIFGNENDVIFKETIIL